MSEIINEIAARTAVKAIRWMEAQDGPEYKVPHSCGFSWASSRQGPNFWIHAGDQKKNEERISVMREMVVEAGYGYLFDVDVVEVGNYRTREGKVALVEQVEEKYAQGRVYAGDCDGNGIYEPRSWKFTGQCVTEDLCHNSPPPTT